MKKQVSLRTFLLSIVLILVVVGGWVWYVQATLPSTTFTISSGVYPGAPSYTVWGEGGTYYAKDSYGLITDSDTNASIVINNALAFAQGTGGVVFLKNGLYIVSGKNLISGVYPFHYYSSLIVYAGETLRGESSGLCIIQEAPYQSDVNVVGAWAATDGAIEDICIDGNRAYQSDVGRDGSMNCIYTSSASFTIKNVHVINAVCYGVYDSNTYFSTDEQIYAYNCGSAGFYADIPSHSYINNIYVKSCGQNLSTYGTKAGIGLNELSDSTVSNCWSISNYMGFYMAGVVYYDYGQNMASFDNLHSENNSYIGFQIGNYLPGGVQSTHFGLLTSEFDGSGGFNMLGMQNCVFDAIVVRDCDQNASLRDCPIQLSQCRNNTFTYVQVLDDQTPQTVDILPAIYVWTTSPISSNNVILSGDISSIPTKYLVDPANLGAVTFQNMLGLPVHSLTSGLVLYYPFDEGTGTIVHDWSGYCNDGAATSTGWEAGLQGYGSSLGFAATGYVDCGDNAVLDLTSDWTFSAWVKGNSTFGYIYQRGTGNVDGIIVSVSALGQILVYTSQAGAYQGTTSDVGIIVADDVNFLVVSKIGTSIRIYVNATDLTAFPETHINAASSTGSSTIGSRTNHDYYWSGVIDEVKIYNWGLSVLDVYNLYISTPIPHSS